MPFDFKKFDAKCANMTVDELQREWEHYTRLISGSATSTAVSGAAIPFTLGVSVIGVGLAAPAIHNARKKREIIERHLQRLGTTHHTRKRDVLTPMAISGTVGLVTLGVGSAGADAVMNQAVEHQMTSVAANEIAVKATVHLAVDGVAMAGEEHHMKQKRLAEQHNAWLQQQQAQTEKVDLATTGRCSPVVQGQQFNGPSNGTRLDAKYEHRPISVFSTASSPLLQYSSSYDEKFQQYFPPPQCYSEKPIFYHASLISASDMAQQGSEKPVVKNASTFLDAQVQSQPTKVPSLPLSREHVQGSDEPTSPSNNAPEVCFSPDPQQQQMASGPTVHGEAQGFQHIHANYPQRLVQQSPQPMYPSYPGSIVPYPVQQQKVALDEAMRQMSFSSPPPPPPPARPTSTATPANAYTTTNPISQQWSTLPEACQAQHNSQTTLCLPPPPPSPAVSAISSSSHNHNPSVASFVSHSASSPTRTPSMSSSISECVPPLRPRISSASSYSSCQQQPQWQDSTYSGHGYATPARNADASYVPYVSPQVEGKGGLLSQYQSRYFSPAPTPGPTYHQPQFEKQGSVSSQHQQSYTTQQHGYLTPSPTPGLVAPSPQFSNSMQPPQTYNSWQQPPAQPQRQQSSYFSSQSPPSHYEDQEHDLRRQSQFGQYGLPTPAGSIKSEGNGGMYFPPPPTQPFVTGPIGGRSR